MLSRLSSMPFESHPKNLSADEARLLHSARLISPAARNMLLVEAGKRLAIERVSRLRAAQEAYEQAQFRHSSGEEISEAAIGDAECAVRDAFHEFFASHLPNLNFHTWAWLITEYYGRDLFYDEVLRAAFEGEVAEVIFGSQDEDETHAAALDLTIEYKILTDSLGSNNPYFSGKWELPPEKLIDFIREWRAAVQAALEAL